ncbi:acyltransferase [Amphritea balenae]|uniref:Acyltransferase n=1 Tax=Amphritea balenae TaxID=452629 RepID=A0A3P1SSU0_9GAMM|nr:acyltransferase [Amphritea balenae]RRD00201.1 acyltransferase [Amphritea balenae]
MNITNLINKIIGNINKYYLRNVLRIRVGKNVVFNGMVAFQSRGQVEIDDNVVINSGNKYNPIGGGSKTQITALDGAFIKIGEGTGMSNVSIFSCDEVEIGKRCLLGNGTKIWDTNFHSISFVDRRGADDDVISKKIRIGDDVFIGGSVIILKGVDVGNKVIIGAGSVVTKSIPANEIWAGNPARFLRKINV